MRPGGCCGDVGNVSCGGARGRVKRGGTSHGGRTTRLLIGSPQAVLFIVLVLFDRTSTSPDTAEGVEEALNIMDQVSSGSFEFNCSVVKLPIDFGPEAWYSSLARKADLAATILNRMPYEPHTQHILKSIAESLMSSDPKLLGVRAELDRAPLEGGAIGLTSAEGRVVSANLSDSPWSTPYYSCQTRKWIVTYSAEFTLKEENGTERGQLSFDVDTSRLEVNQCDLISSRLQIPALVGSHKCHNTTDCVYRGEPGGSWSRGAYDCVCKPGYFMPADYLNLTSGEQRFPGTVVEAMWLNSSLRELQCKRCPPGCSHCTSYKPCLARYSWPFRCLLLSISLGCILCTLCLVLYVYHNRKLKVFKVASPIFLSITLLGCALMYSEMGAIFPILDMYSCVATKWSRHLGFCITYTALLMKTWRVSLTYRVKSAHKVKLTDKQLLQWMFPILLVMLIYLGTWTVSDPPQAQQIKDNDGLIFKQCSFNWWDHSLALGEVLFLSWGIRVCYSVRNAESLFNEARLISFAIYNIAVVNIAMVAFHVFLFPRAGPDIKYLLGFVRTQLSTSVTIGLVFAPKVVRVLRGEGDQWDSRSRSRAVAASFSINGIGLVKEETADLYQENEELKEEIQKLAGQIEFMKIVSMEVNNRHIRPKAGGYFAVNTSGLCTLSSGGNLTPGTVHNSNGGGVSLVVSSCGGSLGGDQPPSTSAIAAPATPQPSGSQEPRCSPQPPNTPVSGQRTENV